LAAEVENAIVVAGLTEHGPASKSGLRPGDRIIAVREDPVASLAGLWRKVWAGGPAGTEIVLRVGRDSETLTVRIQSADRTRFYKAPKLH
jgi:S1-C subfamily serine protease